MRRHRPRERLTRHMRQPGVVTGLAAGPVASSAPARARGKIQCELSRAPPQTTLLLDSAIFVKWPVIWSKPDTSLTSQTGNIADRYTTHREVGRCRGERPVRWIRSGNSSSNG